MEPKVFVLTLAFDIQSVCLSFCLTTTTATHKSYVRKSEINEIGSKTKWRKSKEFFISIKFQKGSRFMGLFLRYGQTPLPTIMKFGIIVIVKKPRDLRVRDFSFPFRFKIVWQCFGIFLSYGQMTWRFS